MASPGCWSPACASTPPPEPGGAGNREDAMIVADGLAKDYRSETGRGHHRVLSDIGFTVARGEKLAVLGRNGAGKSTLIRLIAGIELPTKGRIERSMSLSWPVGLNGGIGGSMTGHDNIRFICR